MNTLRERIVLGTGKRLKRQFNHITLIVTNLERSTAF